MYYLSETKKLIKAFLVFYFAIISLNVFSQAANQKYTISGYIRESGSMELLPGVNLYIPSLKTGTTTNTYGFFSITLENGDYQLIISSVSYKSSTHQINLKNDLELDINLEPDVLMLETIEINAERMEKVSEVSQMSLAKIPVKQIQDIPSLLGEKDVLKTLQLLPGVQSGTEGSSGIYVRGGGPDQNLLILDDATVYNASHLFGFFSVFNGDALKSVELYKGGFPARFGGRLSSVVNMTMKDGNKEKVTGKGGIGLISSNLTLEGPIKKGKSSFLVSARRSYIDLLTRPLMPKDSKGGYNFFDLSTKVNYDFGKKNKLYLSGYFGHDKFWSRDKSFGSTNKAGLKWGNTTGTLRWNHLFNNRLFANTSLIFSDFTFKIFDEEEYQDELFSLDYSSGIKDASVKFDLDFYPNPNHSIKAGFMVTQHVFTPKAFVLKDTEVDEFIDEKTEFKSKELGIFIEDDFIPFPKMMINAGVRFSLFADKDKSYTSLEPRMAFAYKIGPSLSAKASYAEMNQYVHLLSNSGIGLPTDLWVPSTAKVKPQNSKQVAIGLAKDIPDKNVSITLEGYYKTSRNIINYKEGASFLDIEDVTTAEEFDFQDKIVFGKGTSYGVELFLQRKFGKFTGWFGYTLSWTKQKFDSLNFGKTFFAKYDRRHDLSLVGIYKPHDRITLSGTFVYGSGQAFTLPVTLYTFYGHGNVTSSGFPIRLGTVEGFKERGNFRGESYHRMDFGIQFHKNKKKGVRTWELSVYNLYSRKNPFFYFAKQKYDIVTDTSARILTKITIFPLIPSISYKFEF